jgi:hypothetical protein
MDLKHRVAFSFTSVEGYGTVLNDMPTSIAEVEKRPLVDAPLYDLQGRRVDAEPQKGIYIRNGRKVVRTK